AIDYANLGLCLKALGEKEQAKFYCQRALSLDPSLDFAKKALEELGR
ncbi:MAG TPA: tetratricopeptide repeat protein, partial [Candidatus Desulfofervidus auxilii]|nr:tetratricopeptide repeat protein [Candidatus Desulfofervidus auxilii]